MALKNSKKVLIVGGGIGGISAGCYLQMNGFETTILEKNSLCGGVSVSWRRGKYIFDGATNWLAGSSPSANMHELLAELIDFHELQCINHDEFISVELENETFHVYCDAEKLQKEMLRISPEDSKTILEFTTAVKKVGTFSLPYKKAPELFTIFDYISMVFNQLPFLLFFLKWKKVTIGQFSSRFRSPLLQRLFLGIFPHHHHFSIFSILMTLGWMHIKSGGYPIGGSARFLDILEKKYKSIGGKILTGTEVCSILLEKNRAIGVATSDGKSYFADHIISSVDMHYTLNTLLKNHSVSPEITKRIDSYPVFPSLIQVSIGCNRTISEMPHKIQMKLNQPLYLDNNEYLSDMMVRICHFDPTLSPQGTTAIVTHFRTCNYQYWTSLRETNPEEYQKQKEKIAQAVIETLEKRLGNIKSTLEKVDIATPATFIRYTNIYKGSYQGWAPTPALIGRTLPRELKNIKNFYFAGQWIWPAGGLPGVIRIGRQTAQIICKKTGIAFNVNNGKVIL